MMTPEQIQDEAIEAAMKAAHAVSGTHSGRKIAWEDEEKWVKLEWREEILAAIQAYEAAMWRPVEEAPNGVDVLVRAKVQPDLCFMAQRTDPELVHPWCEHSGITWSDGGLIDFRPLPKPPEVKS